MSMFVLLRRAPLGTQLSVTIPSLGFWVTAGRRRFVSVMMYNPGEIAVACPRFEHVAILTLLASPVLDRPLGWYILWPVARGEEAR